MNHLRKYRTEYTGVALLLPFWLYAIVSHKTGWTPFDEWYNIAFTVAAILLWPAALVVFIVRRVRRVKH